MTWNESGSADYEHTSPIRTNRRPAQTIQAEHSPAGDPPALQLK